MPLKIPTLSLPLGGVSVCANRISLSEHPDLASLVSQDRADDIAETSDGCLRLIREKIDGNKAHLHLDHYAKGFLTKYTPNCTLDEILKRFDLLMGKSLVVGFESRFRLSKDEIPKGGLVNAMGGVGIEFGGTKATLSGANIRLNDTVYKEIRWKQWPGSAGKNAGYFVEIMGTIGSIPITNSLLDLTIDRAVNGLHRFVLPKAAKVKP